MEQNWSSKMTQGHDQSTNSYDNRFIICSSHLSKICWTPKDTQMIPLPDIRISAYEKSTNKQNTNKHSNFYNDDETIFEEDDNTAPHDTDQLLLDDTHLNVPPIYPAAGIGRGKSYLSPLMSRDELRRIVSSPIKDSLLYFKNNNKKKDSNYYHKNSRHGGEDIQDSDDMMDLLTSESSASEEEPEDEDKEDINSFISSPRFIPQQPPTQHDGQKPQQCTHEDLQNRSIRRSGTSMLENRFSLAAAAEQFAMVTLENERRISVRQKKKENAPLRIAKTCIRTIVGKDKVT